MKNYIKVFSTKGQVKKLRPRIKEKEIRSLKLELIAFKRVLNKGERQAWRIEMSAKHGLLTA